MRSRRRRPGLLKTGAMRSDGACGGAVRRGRSGCGLGVCRPCAEQSWTDGCWLGGFGRWRARIVRATGSLLRWRRSPGRIAVAEAGAMVLVR
ncbi:hypothetical protein Taro_016918 [Colocasia esculenta]|uniref:Uncharacterized protein n=1 Tax=Colocasia esculenta TaxID=4460 RepID=A0A843URM4_COLES|nr:hypothetical protein [Colocasia esculenta]